MKLLLVCGPWGSGTTAVAGLLERLGASGFGPYFHSNDERTPNTYELMAFRQLIRQYVTIPTLSSDRSRLGELERDLARFRRQIEQQQFGAYDPRADRPIFLKYPPSALFLPEICRTFETRIVSLARPVAEIERTRLRRNWPEIYGRAGAEILYGHIAKAIGSQIAPSLTADYRDVIASPAEFAQRVVEFAAMEVEPWRLEAAAAFIRQGAAPASA